MPTTPTQIRLTDEDRAEIEWVRARYGLPSMAAAIRYAVQTVRRAEGFVPLRSRKKNPGRPGKSP